MLKRLLSVALMLVLTNVVAISAYARAQSDEQIRKIERVKASIHKLGVGEAARLQIKLRDGREFAGFIREARDDDFVIVEAKTCVPITVLYSQVTQVKGHNRLTAAKVAVNVAKGAAIVAGVAGMFLLLGIIFLPRT
jgi:urease accessory protein UreE